MDEQHKATADNRKRVGAEGERKEEGRHIFPILQFPSESLGQLTPSAPATSVVFGIRFLPEGPEGGSQ